MLCVVELETFLHGFFLSPDLAQSFLKIEQTLSHHALRKQDTS